MALSVINRLAKLKLPALNQNLTVNPNQGALPPPPQQTSQSPYNGRYTLDMDPRVVAALYEEKQGLADLNSTPMPSMQSTAQYDQQLAHLREMLPINLERLAHQNVIDQRNIQNSLAARGMSRSGETPYNYGELAYNYQNKISDLQRQERWSEEAVSAARAAANSAYQEAVAARAQGIKVSQRDLHNHVIDAYVQAYQDVISNPALYLGADANFDPRQFLGQIPQ